MGRAGRCCALIISVVSLCLLVLPAASATADTTPPELGYGASYKEGRGSVQGVDGYWYDWVGPVTWEMFPHDPEYESEPCWVQWAIDDDPWAIYVAPFTLNRFGIHPIRAECYDSAGNLTSVTINGPSDYYSNPSFLAIDNVGPRTRAEAATVRRFERAVLRYRLLDRGSTEDRITIKIKNRAGRTLEKYSVGYKGINGTYVYRPRIFLRRGSYKWFVYAVDLTGNKQALVGSNALTVR